MSGISKNPNTGEASWMASGINQDKRDVVSGISKDINIKRSLRVGSVTKLTHEKRCAWDQE